MKDDDIPENDHKLFLQAMRGVKPLKNKKTITPAVNHKTLNSIKKPATQQFSPINLYLSNSNVEDISASEVISYLKPGLDKNLLKKLKQGKISYTAKIDLHGMRLDTAETALSDFIITRSNSKVVLVIHGKGGHNRAILKTYTNHWLKQIPKVLAFHSALPKDGGTGAMYVLLKNSNKYENN